MGMVQGWEKSNCPSFFRFPLPSQSSIAKVTLERRML